VRSRADVVAVAALVATLGTSALATAAPRLRGDWTEAERAAVDAAVGRLPDVVRARLPRAVARDARSCAADAPVDAAGTVHVCATAAPSEIVVGLLLGFDRAVGWSDEPDWRRLSGWSSPLLGEPTAENVSPAGFADPRGRRSPRWELATFLEAASRAPDDVPCRLMSQARFVRQHVAALGGAVAAPACAAFERWAELDRLADVEVVLAAPSTAMVGSLFGHLFLRLVVRDEGGQTPPHLSRTVAFLADNDVPFEVDRGYAWKGITGAYTASLHERPFLDAFREYVVVEGRDLRRWRLALTADERRALLERLWTAGEGGRYRYTFFRRNCATLMMSVVEDAVPALRAVGHGHFVASPPASSLEVWARARAAGGVPALTFVAEPLPSFDHEARLRSRHRVELEARLVAAAPDAARPGLADDLRAARSPDEATRAGAYGRVAERLSGGVGAPEDVQAWWRDGAAIESHLTVVANQLAEARADAERRARVRRARDELARALVGDAQLGTAVALVGDDDRERRMDGYRALLALVEEAGADADRAGRLRLLALLESEAWYDVARLRRDPALRDALLFPALDLPISEQAYVRGHEELVVVPVVTAVSVPLRALQRARETLAEARALPPATPAPDATLAARETYDAALRRSGIDQTSVSAGGVLGRAGLAPALGLGGALYDERLGDRRRFGFPSDTAFVVARSDVWLGRGAGAWPAALAYEARALGYRSLRLPLPEANASRVPLGWDVHLDVRGSRARAVAAEVEAAWGVLARLADRDELATHVLASAAVAYVGAFPTPDAPTGAKPQALAAPLALEARAALGAGYRSWLAARAAVAPGAVLAAAPRRLFYEATAALEVHVGLGVSSDADAHDPALLVRAALRRSTSSLLGPGADVEAWLAVGVELR
jgi:hypothetical protein